MTTHIAFFIKKLEGIGGGAERVLRDVAQGLSEREYDVTVLSMDRKGARAFYPFPQAVQWIQLEGSYYRLRQWLAQNQPERTVGFMVSAYFPLSLISIGLGLKLYGSEHSHRRDFSTIPKRFALWLSSRRLIKITALSQQIKEGFPSLTQHKMQVIPNPIPKVKGQTAKTDKEQGPLICLAIGHLSESKNQKTLVAAFAQIAADFPLWTLRIIGEGHLRAELEAQVKQEGLADRVFLPGYSSNVSDEYSNAHLFVIPSLYEGYGLVVAEAISHALPAIGFADCPGVNEIITPDYNGLLLDIKPGQTRVTALAEAMRQLMKSSKKRRSLVPKETSFPDRNEIALKWVEFLDLPL